MKNAKDVLCHICLKDARKDPPKENHDEIVVCGSCEEKCRQEAEREFSQQNRKTPSVN